jgi:hypothetical protein
MSLMKHLIFSTLEYLSETNRIVKERQETIAKMMERIYAQEGAMLKPHPAITEAAMNIAEPRPPPPLVHNEEDWEKLMIDDDVTFTMTEMPPSSDFFMSPQSRSSSSSLYGHIISPPPLLSRQRQEPPVLFSQLEDATDKDSSPSESIDSGVGEEEPRLEDDEEEEEQNEEDEEGGEYIPPNKKQKKSYVQGGEGTERWVTKARVIEPILERYIPQIRKMFIRKKQNERDPAMHEPVPLVRALRNRPQIERSMRIKYGIPPGVIGRYSERRGDSFVVVLHEKFLSHWFLELETHDDVSFNDPRDCGDVVNEIRTLLEADPGYIKLKRRERRARTIPARTSPEPSVATSEAPPVTVTVTDPVTSENTTIVF